ncbi:MAG: Acetyl esterase Axe7A precursor [Lentisphaerae bacterium ADurb.Bin242]|nr:MAG: Acetyl esterase Axe7A precursor [Lentisphaerae bacterium ADurb.Bin242]
MKMRLFATRLMLGAMFLLGCAALSAQEVLWKNSFDTREEREKFTRNGSCHDLTGGVDGSGCLVFQRTLPEGNAVTYELDAKAFRGKRVTLSGMLKAKDLQVPENRHWGPKLALYYRTAAGRENWIESAKEYGSYDWKKLSCTATIPADAEKLQVVTGPQRTAGTLWVDELEIVEAAPSAAAQSGRYENHIVTGWLDRESAEYRAGEPMHFYFRLLDGGLPVKGRVRVVLAADDGRKQTWDAAISEKEPLHITTFLNQPGFVMARVVLLDGEDRPVKRANANGALRDIQYGLAGGVEPEALRQGEPEPEDFDAFWRERKRRLADIPLRVLEKKPFRTTEKSEIFDVKLSCVGKRPVSGYLAIPKGAKPGTLPIRMHYDGYSVRSAQVVDSGRGIDFFVNPHGIENGREESYYAELAKGELSGYGFDNEKNRTGDDSYFNVMILRDLRALEYAKMLPEWNGRDIEVHGGSQGAFQALAVAALNSDVTSCEINIPWFCDLGGVLRGRVRGWRPDYQPGLGYYDTVNFARRVRCPVAVTAGLSDWVCPPSGVMVLYNNLPGPKRLTLKQGLDHAVYLGYDHAKAARREFRHPAAP